MKISNVIGIGILLLFLSTLNLSYSSGVETFTPDVSITVTATATTTNEAIWMLPGPRSLDPTVFGTPSDPLKTNWLPTSMRNTTLDGSEYTTASAMTPFSNNTKSITGAFNLEVKDITKFDDPTSLDEASVSANFTDPTGKTEYYVSLAKLIPVGPDHPFFGGVGLNTFMHGATEIGTPLMPAGISYVTLWGFGDLYINGTMIDSMRLIHVMVSERLRTPDFKLGFEVQDPNSLEIHLILPNTKVNSSGPYDNPVPTQFILPNGVEQPFFHVNFYNIEVTRSEPTVTETEITTNFETIFTTSVITDTSSAPGFTIIFSIFTLLAIVPLLSFTKRKKRT